jgi:beta-galactosidase
MMSGLRRLLSVTSVVCALLAWLPAAASATAGVPPALTLTNGWQYAADPGDLGASRHWESSAAGLGPPWRRATVPGVFDARPLKPLFGGTVGWYRVSFRGPDTPGFDWAARFEQVRRVARIWLNGIEIGGHSDPYVPFTVPLEGLRRGEPNTLVLRVDNRKDKELREGWWNWGGITRPVTLVPLGGVALRDLGLLSQVRCEHPGNCRAAVVFEGKLTNRTARRVQPAVSVRLVAPESGRPTAYAIPVRSILPGETALVRRTLPVPGTPQLWSPESPRLYDATVSTRLGAAVQQVDRLRIGLRSVTVRGGQLLLNGHPLDLRGASIQEDVPGRGPALSDRDMDRIVADLQALRANVTRAHYLLNERLLQRLDRAGILVWSQAPIYHRDSLLETPAQRAAALATLRDTVLVARNHPSVLTHSVANELSVTPDSAPGTRAYLDDARRVVRELDPTLPLSVDLLSYPGFPRQRTYAQFELVGVNSYFGWYPGKRAHPTGRLADLGPYLKRLRTQYPRQALVLTEFGAESTMDGPAGRKETYAFQSQYLRQVLGIVERLPFMSGAIYWTLHEFAVKPDWDGGAKRDVPRDAIHNKGLISYSGRPKPAWRIARADFAATPLYRAAQAAGPRDASPGPLGVLLVALLCLAILAVLMVNLRTLIRILSREPAEARRGSFGAPPPARAPARVVARP